jgi:hypothetical protein
MGKMSGKLSGKRELSLHIYIISTAFHMYQTVNCIAGYGRVRWFYG